MNSLDFLNSQHQYYIFGKETNKTNFGGVLFLIYLIIMIFISLIYILDYALNEKYEIASHTIDTFFTTRYKEGFDESQVDKNINQKMEFKIYLEINDYHDIDITKTEDVVKKVTVVISYQFKGKTEEVKLSILLAREK